MYALQTHLFRFGLFCLLRIGAFVVIAHASGCANPSLDAGPTGAPPIAADRDTDLKLASDYPIDLARLIGFSVHVNSNGVPSSSDFYALPAVASPAVASKDNLISIAAIEQARKYFYDNCSPNPGCGVLRDRVQDRLIWASESSCADYLGQVRKSFTNTNLNLGSATTLFGALGSIVKAVDATRIFSGAAAVSSGIRAEYNDVYFSSQAFELISKAIRSTREKSLKAIQNARHGKDVLAYTLEAAVGDAMRYHTSCSIMAGLEEASEAVTRERDPGLKRVSELMQSIGVAGNISIGISAIDTTTLPSVAQSCGQLSDIIRSGTTANENATNTYKKVSKDDTVTEEKKKVHDSSFQKITKLASDLTTLTSTSNIDCTGPDSLVTKAEVEMFKAVREFAALPLSEKNFGKAEFDAARAKVGALKVKVDAWKVSAQQIVDDILVTSKDLL